jgi:putative ABC transport system permease protein
MRDSARVPVSRATSLSNRSSGANAPKQRYQHIYRQGMIGPNVSSALEALWANRMRSLLTMLGVVIGVMAVIAAVSITQGASLFINSTLANLGTNSLAINSGTAVNGGVFAAVGSDQSLTPNDAKAVTKVAHIANVSPLLNVNAQVIYGNQNWNTRVHGVYPNVQSIQAWQLAQGSWFTSSDEMKGRPVAVIGQIVASSLFDKTKTDPIGHPISINGIPFRVVGVLQSKGSIAGVSQDDIIFIPFQTELTRLKNSYYIDQIVAQVDNADYLAQVQAQITTLLKKQHHLAAGSLPDFQIRSANQILQISQQFAQALTFLLVGIAAISLTVGGIGIMNIMLVSVTERRREIGIRMAVGAQRSDIRSQFLIEAVTLSAVGGIIGILLGLGVGLTLTLVFHLPFVLNPVSILLAFGVSTAVGITFGLYPAVRASHLDPIVALRVE